MIISFLKSDLSWLSLICGFTLFIYCKTLAPTVLFGDGGEFQFVLWLPGIAHPTGYPLYTLLGWVFSHGMVIGEVAWRLNFLSALLGVITIGLVYLISNHLTILLFPQLPSLIHRCTATALALTFAFSPTYWSQAIITEVYTLHALFVGLILWCCLRGLSNGLSKGDIREVNLLAFIFGLSLTHHRTTVLMLPSLILYLWLVGLGRISLKQGLRVSLLLFLPSFFYFYLPLIAPYVPYLQLSLSDHQTLILYENTLQGLWGHVWGTAFGGAVRPTGLDLVRFLFSLDLLDQQVGWGGIILGLLGLIKLFSHKALFSLTLGSFLGFAVFNLIYFVGDVHVLFIPCWLIFCLWMGVGMLSLAGWVVNRRWWKDNRLPDSLDRNKYGNFVSGYLHSSLEVARKAKLSLILPILLLILPMSSLLTQYSQIDQSQNTLARDAWQEILAQDLAPNAVLISNDRNDMMPLWYYQYVEKQRPDLLGLFPLITPAPAYETIGGVIDQAFLAQRPVYLVKPMAGLEIKADLSPLPPTSLTQLYHASQPKSQPDYPLNLSFDDELALLGLDQTIENQELTVTLYWQPFQRPHHNYTSYVHVLDSTNQRVAQSDHLPGGQVYPSGHWQAGEILRDTHQVRLPKTLHSTEYTLVAGLYHQPESGLIVNLGESQVIEVLP